MAAAKEVKNVPLILEFADVIGLLLLILMVAIVCWKAITRQTVGGADAFVGLLGVAAMLIPIVTQLTFKGMGVEVAAIFRESEEEKLRVFEGYDKAFAELKGKVETMEHTVAALRQSQNRLSSLTAGLASSDAAASQIKSAVILKEPAERDYTVFIFFRLGTTERAQLLERKLLAEGFKATSRFSSLKEVVEQQEEGVARIIHREKVPNKVIKQIADLVRSTQQPDTGRTVVRDNPLSLASGDIQIQLF